MTKLRSVTSAFISLALIIPVSSNYSLQQINVGSGGVGQTDSYKFEGIMGENGLPVSGTAYNGGLGFGFTQMADVPPAPTVTNPDNYYNKLHITIDPSDNPSDALFALAISVDNFATTQYIKSDQAIGATLDFTDYQTYAMWGGGAGFDVMGLQPSTTYKVKVKAFQGDFTESGFGPAGSASTVAPQLTFDIDVAPTDSVTSPPYNLDLGTLTSGNISTGSSKIWISISSNALAGTSIYIAGQNAGLLSQTASYQIDTVDNDLGIVAEGYGLQSDSLTQTSGGPLTADSSYTGAGNSVGAIPAAYQLLATSGAPITDGRGSFVLKAKSKPLAPAAVDYQELLTVVAAAHF